MRLSANRGKTWLFNASLEFSVFTRKESLSMLLNFVSATILSLNMSRPPFASPRL
jgi:hypothetical protein